MAFGGLDVTQRCIDDIFGDYKDQLLYLEITQKPSDGYAGNVVSFHTCAGNSAKDKCIHFGRHPNLL